MRRLPGEVADTVGPVDPRPQHRRAAEGRRARQLARGVGGGLPIARPGAPGAGGGDAARDAERGWGRIVNVGSTSTSEPIPYLTLSNSQRQAAVGFLKTLSREVAGDGMTVNTVRTGRFATERLASNWGPGRRWSAVPSRTSRRDGSGRRASTGTSSRFCALSGPAISPAHDPARRRADLRSVLPVRLVCASGPRRPAAAIHAARRRSSSPCSRAGAGSGRAAPRRAPDELDEQALEAGAHQIDARTGRRAGSGREAARAERRRGPSRASRRSAWDARSGGVGTVPCGYAIAHGPFQLSVVAITGDLATDPPDRVAERQERRDVEECEVQHSRRYAQSRPRSRRRSRRRTRPAPTRRRCCRAGRA